MLHRGARPAPRELPEPEQFVALHRTLGVESNGSVSNMAFTAATATRLGHELRSGSYDVLHVHEPNAGLVPWYAIENARVPVVGTFHAYATKPVPMAIGNLLGQRRLFNKRSGRIGVPEAARGPGEPFYGGRSRTPPTGIDMPRPLAAPNPANERLELLFAGRADGRRGLPVLLRAFEALRPAGV